MSLNGRPGGRRVGFQHSDRRIDTQQLSFQLSQPAHLKHQHTQKRSADSTCSHFTFLASSLLQNHPCFTNANSAALHTLVVNHRKCSGDNFPSGDLNPSLDRSSVESTKTKPLFRTFLLYPQKLTSFIHGKLLL